MDPKKLRAAVGAQIQAKLAERKPVTDELAALRSAVEAADATVTDEQVRAAIAKRDAIDAELDVLEARATELAVELEREAAIDRLQASVGTGTAPAVGTQRAYDQVHRVGSEERTYAPHREPHFDSRTGQFRAGAKPGAGFQADVVAALLGDWEASQRLARHTAEERVERGEYLQRAVGTGAFAGLTVPQYLTDMYAPAAAARRPFADAIRSYPLPATGNVVQISRVTTATSAADQANEGDAASETDIDDTLLTINLRTAAGAQTMSRQSIERGIGTENVVLDDLFRRYATNLDSQLINASTVGLTNVATAVTYTDASPTAAELYPKVLEALSGVEAALLDMASGENIAVMHSRRWYWMQSQVGTSWPFVGQPGLPAQQGAVNLGTTYGSGQRGLLPNGTPVIVDNNIATNKGAGTNEDEIYLVDRNECHLWEDPSAPFFIRAEQRAAKNLQIDLVIYGYYAFTHSRYAHSRKISGTGLVTPTF